MLSTELAKREDEENPIRVGVIGAGKFGSGLVTQLMQTPGMSPSAVADIDLDRARHAYTSSGVPEGQITTVDTPLAISDAIVEERATTDNALALAESGMVDVVVEATGLPDVGARTA